MKRSALLLVVCLAAVLLGTSPSAAQQKVSLRPRWEKGAVHRFRMDLASTNSVNLSGAKDEAGAEGHALKQDIRFALTVIDAPPEADATVELTYESFKVSLESPMGKGQFDSTTRDGSKGGGGGKKPGGEDADPAEGLVADVFKPLVGAKLLLVIDPEGNIKSVSGGEALMPADMTAPLTKPTEMSRLFGPIFSPKKGTGLVMVGESWENVDLIDSGLIGRFKMTTKHTLRSATREAVVAIDGRIETDSESPERPYAIKNGTYTGSYAWGIAEGMLRRMESSMSFEIEGRGDEPMSIGSKVTMKVTRED